MKCVILAGGQGSRLSEVSNDLPKPLVPIGDRPILWHIMRIYLAYDVNDFIICLGHKGSAIKSFFHNYALYCSDVTFDYRNGTVEYHNNVLEPWRITLVDTGEHTMTGGRIKRLSSILEKEDIFYLTYGDGLANVDIEKQTAFHRAHGKMATITAVNPSERFGALEIKNGSVISFREKPVSGTAINGGFMILSSSILDLIDDDSTILEEKPLNHLAHSGQLMAWPHDGFWQPMDTPRELAQLTKLWQTGSAPWKLWD